MEKVEYKNVDFTVWDTGGQGLHKLRPIWKHYFNNNDCLVRINFLVFISLFSLKRTFALYWLFPSHVLFCVFMQIYVVDSLDRERIDHAKEEFQVTKSNFSEVFDHVCV